MNKKNDGLFYAICAYTFWGILPVYWKLIKNISPIEILANRVTWSLLFMLIIVTISKQWKEVRFIIKNKKSFMMIFMSSILITINWGLYIFAINNNRIVEASLGYYMNPILSTILGIIIFRETLNYLTVLSIFTAFIGIMIEAVQYGKFPWISLFLAISFSLYSVIKKQIKTTPTVGLMLEVAMITPVALIYLVFKNIIGTGALNKGTPLEIILLIGTGIVTAIPLLLFASSAKKVSLSVIGFTQYISPTISLILGIVIYNENFKISDIVAFSFVWLSIFIFIISNRLEHKSKVISKLIK